jgi:hypothetical protein
MTELAASDASTQAVVRNGNRIVFELVREVILALSHGTYEDTDALFGTKSRDVILDTDDFSLERQCYLAAIGR